MSKLGESWADYVREVMGNDRQVDASMKTGLDQTTISKWLNPATDVQRRTSQSVRRFALGYNVPVLEALVAAGFITPTEAGISPRELMSYHDRSTDELMSIIDQASTELARRAEQALPDAPKKNQRRSVRPVDDGDGESA